MNVPDQIKNLTPEEFASFFDQIPIAISIYDRAGFQVAVNKASEVLFNIHDAKQWLGTFNMITDPQLVASGSIERHQRVMAGETIVTPPHPFVANASGHGDASTKEQWIEATYAPMRNDQGDVTHLIALLRDVTTEVNQKQIISAVQAEINTQHSLIESISTPVIQVWEGILTMPLVGTIDSHRAMQVIESLLTMIAERQAECVIIDITGVPIVDTQVAQHIIRAAQASKLLGCEVALVGIGVEMAQTLVQLGVDLHQLTTMANLQAGIAWAFRQRGMQVVAQA